MNAISDSRKRFGNQFENNQLMVEQTSPHELSAARKSSELAPLLVLVLEVVGHLT